MSGHHHIQPPSFVERDPAKVEREMVQLFEQLTGRTLHPAQPERIFISVMAYRETLLRQQIQDVGEQALLAFARAPMLDFLGEIVGTERLPAQAATVPIQFTLGAVRGEVVTVPAGTRVQTADGRVVFATGTALEIPAGALAGSVQATASVPGVLGNGYAAGEVSQILDPVAFVSAAANTATTSGGTEIEDDERYRDRIRQAPEQFSSAGSVGAYRFHALSADPAVAHVEITNPSAGVVRIHVLSTSGLPSAALIAEVQAAVSAETVRPLTDTVEVVAPTEVPFAITATIYPRAGEDAAAVLAAAQGAAEAYAAERRAGLGRDIVPAQIIAALYVPGVYDVALAAPGPRAVLPSEWADCTSITLTLGGAVDG